MRRAALLTGVVVLVAAPGLSACGSPLHPHLAFGPASALYDTPLTATVDGLHPGATVSLTLTSQDAVHTTWSSTATYTADAQGTVTLDTPATGGAYTGSDAAGLVDALYPTSGVVPTSMSVPSPWRLTLAARAGGRDVGSVTVTRLAPTDVGVTTTTLTVAADGLAGVMAEPAETATPGPAVVVWGGSEGGLTTTLYAETLAAHGYPALALAYFREPGLPNDLVDVPMEYFARAVTYLDGRPGVDAARVAVSGASRGSEAALLLGTERPDLVHGVLSLSGSSVVNAGYPDTSAAAWTYRGAPVAHAPVSEFGHADPPGGVGVIPVERVDGPVLVECGDHDTEWPSCAYAAAVTSRRASRPTTAVTEPGAGHHVNFVVPWVPAPDGAAARATIEDGGGTAVANGRARVLAWPRLLAFVAAVP